MVKAKDPGSRAEAKRVQERLRKAGVEAVGLAMVDNAGVTRVKVVPVGRFTEAVRSGIGLSNVFSVFLSNDDITSAPGFEGPAGDTRLVPDPAATVALAAMPGWAWAPADQRDQEGEPWGACPRTFLKRSLQRLADHGLTLQAAFEAEFFLGRRAEARRDEEPDPEPGHVGPAYGAEALTRGDGFLRDVIRALEDQGTGVLQMHAEYGIGQYEVSIPHRDGLGAADDNVILRQTIRAAARRHGLSASFAPVVFAGAVGNGMHAHLSLADADRPNLFAGGDGPEGMTAEAEAFCAGVLAELPALTSIACPSVPSYQRLQPHKWAGAFACWGRENREAAMRFVTGMIGGRERTANMEVKAMDPSANPYLALGAIVAAGVAGLERGLRLPEPVLGFPDQVPARRRKAAGIRRLPGSLGEAIRELERSALLKEAMGEPLFDSFLAVRRAEWAAFGDLEDEAVVRAHRWRY